MLARVQIALRGIRGESRLNPNKHFSGHECAAISRPASLRYTYPLLLRNC